MWLSGMRQNEGGGGGRGVDEMGSVRQHFYGNMCPVESLVQSTKNKQLESH